MRLKRPQWTGCQHTIPSSLCALWNPQNFSAVRHILLPWHESPGDPRGAPRVATACSSRLRGLPCWPLCHMPLPLSASEESAEVEKSLIWLLIAIVDITPALLPPASLQPSYASGRILCFLTSSLGHVPFPFISSTFFSHVKKRCLSLSHPRLPPPPPPSVLAPPFKKTAALHSSWLSWRTEQYRPCNRTAQTALYLLCRMLP